MKLLSKKVNLFLIHGAWSTNRAFNYIEKSISHKNVKDIIKFEYDVQSNSLDNVVKKAEKELTQNNEPYILIGHSLGGLVALNLHDISNVKKIITLASPLSGINIDKMFQPYIYSQAPVLATLNPRSNFIDNIHEKSYNKPIRCLIATKGFNPLMREPSDGVVTIESQTVWLPESAYQYEIKASHYEILQHEETVRIINENIS